jgi:dTDP-4-dehydrorhamnose reductase
MEKIFVTGGSGLLGSNIIMAARSRFEVYASYNKNRVEMSGARFLKADLTDKSQLKHIEQLNPNLIIHCAALTNIDGCEDNPDEAYRQNVLTSKNIAELANQTGAYLIHISTDAVFDGRRGNYSEADKPNPISVYGKTKLHAEHEVLSIHPSSSVVRTNFYGWNKRDKFSLAEWMLNKLENNDELPAFKDIIYSPILVNNLIVQLFVLYDKKFSGIIHLAGGESCSKLDFANVLAEVFALDKSLIKTTSIDDLNLRASRGKNINLDVSRAQKLLNTPLPKVREGLVEMKCLRERGYVEALKHE